MNLQEGRKVLVTRKYFTVLSMGIWYKSKRGGCFEVTNVSFESWRDFELYLSGLESGSYRLECYAEYIRDGETRRTNVVGTQISVSR